MRGKFFCLIICLFFLLVFFSNAVCAKDLELVLHKTFLQKLVDKVFPMKFSESYSPSLQIPNMEGALSLEYKVDIYKPVLSMYANYIQLDATSSMVSFFGNKKFPVRCKMIPIYNSADNNVELKVIEGRLDLDIDSNGSSINLGSIDFSHRISNIRIPLQMNNIVVQNKTIKPRFNNVTFQFFKDKIIMNSEVLVE